MKKYNEKRENEKLQMEEAAKKTTNEVVKKVERPTRAGGVYIPPHKLREMESEMRVNNKNTNEY
jgi:pre-mRNA-splicing factor CWC22